jgi:hypothetical protein
MKKILLSLTLISSSVFLFAQITNPCISTIDVINNSNGATANCPSTFPGNAIQSANASFAKEGEVRVSFTNPLPSPQSAPVILSVTDLQGNPVLDIHNNPINVRFVWEPTASGNRTSTNVLAYYCYYSDNGNLFNGSGIHYHVTIQYPNSNPQVCDVVNIPPPTLPVHLTYFNAKRSNTSSVGLTWQTAQELNSSGFEIQRQVGSGGWQIVGFVSSQALNGNSSSLLSYGFSDLNNAKGITQYRLRAVDIDANSKFSEIRAVRGEGQAGKIIVYPNPSFDGKVKVVFEDVNGSRDVSLTDMSGRLIKQWTGITNNNLQIDNITPGYYSLRVVIRETGEQSIEKIVVNKR